MSAATTQSYALRRDGFVVVPSLFDAEEVRSISAWADELERLPETPGRQMMYFEPSLLRPGERVLQRIENFYPFHPGFAALCDGDTLRGPDNQLPHEYVLPQAWRTALPEELYPTSYVVERTLAWLDGFAQRKDDAPFKAVADKTIAGLMKDGTVATLYKKWFEQPVPPKGLNLDFPLSDDMKALIKNPNDKALD